MCVPGLEAHAFPPLCSCSPVMRSCLPTLVHLQSSGTLAGHPNQRSQIVHVQYSGTLAWHPNRRSQIVHLHPLCICSPAARLLGTQINAAKLCICIHCAFAVQRHACLASKSTQPSTRVGSFAENDACGHACLCAHACTCTCSRTFMFLCVCVCGSWYSFAHCVLAAVWVAALLT